MYKLSSQIIDYYDDENLLLDILKEDIPEIVKKAHILNHDQLNELIDDDFAVVIMTKTGKLRKFPINDKSHTVLSCEAFKKTAHKLPLDTAEIAASNIYSSCIYHGVKCPDEIIKLAKDISNNISFVNEDKAVPMEYHLRKKIAENKNKSIYGPWGVTIKTASGVENKYPLNSTENIKRAIEYFNKYASKMLPEYKIQFARNIYKQASINDISVPSNISSYSRATIGDMSVSNISKRYDLLKEAKHKEFISKFINSHKNMKINKAIQLLEDFDKLAGIDKFWNKKIKDPYLTLLEKTSENKRKELSSKEDIKNYAITNASFELKGHLPEELIDKFLQDPIKTYNKMTDIQKEVIFRGINGVLK